MRIAKAKLFHSMNKEDEAEIIQQMFKLNITPPSEEDVE
jgi:hypothetical protein